VKHTPPPYYLDDGAIYDSCGAKIADVYYNHLGSGVPNAEFIVRACNAHEDLIEVLRLITECDDYRGIKTGEMRVGREILAKWDDSSLKSSSDLGRLLDSGV
jgi:hypothetical protein